MAKTITEPRRKIKMDWKDRLFHTINYTAFILFALICFYPFYYLFISTISRNDFVDLGKITFYPIGCCFSKRMRKVFRKNEKSMLQNCNKKAKRKGRLQRVKKPM